jgi:Tfp pilus assembly protein PilV
VHRPSRRGLTLLEVIASLALLMVGGLGLIGVLPDAARLDACVQAQSEHLALAEQKLDELTRANASISESWTSDQPHGAACGCVRQWRGMADENGGSGVQVVEVQISWRQEHRTAQLSLYGMVAP